MTQMYHTCKFGEIKKSNYANVTKTLTCSKGFTEAYKQVWTSLLLPTFDLYSHRLHGHQFSHDPFVTLLDHLIHLTCKVSFVCFLNVYKKNHTVDIKEPLFKMRLYSKNDQP